MSTAEPWDASVSIGVAQAVSAAWVVVAVVLVLGPFWLLWGEAPLAGAVVRLGHPLVIIPGAIVAVLAHEWLHAFGFRTAGRAPASAVHIGLDRRTLTPFARCETPVTAAAYRIAALLPLAVLGALPAVAGWATGSGMLAVIGVLMVAVAGGDVVAVWAIRQVSPAARVLDHPSRVGCMVLPA